MAEQLLFGPKTPILVAPKVDIEYEIIHLDVLLLEYFSPAVCHLAGQVFL